MTKNEMLKSTKEMLNSNEFCPNGTPRVLTDEEAKIFAGDLHDPEQVKYFWWCMASAEEMENME